MLNYIILAEEHDVIRGKIIKKKNFEKNNNFLAYYTPGHP